MSTIPLHRRTSCLLSAAVWLLAVAQPFRAAAAAEPTTAPWKWTAEAVVDTVTVANVALSPDGSSVVFTRSRWRGEQDKPGPAYADLWRVPYAGGEPQRLTYFGAAISSPRFSPDGTAIAYLAEHGEEETKARLHVLPTAGGESRPLTDEELDVQVFAWAPDGKTIAYVAKDPQSAERKQAEKIGRDEKLIDRDLRPRRLWLVDVASGAARPVRALGEESVWHFDWSPDGSAVVASVSALNRVDDSYMSKRIRVLPLQGEGRDLVPVVGKLGELKWSPDGRTIAYLGGVDSSDPSLGSLFVVPAAGGVPRNLSGARQETAQALHWLPDNRIALVSVSGTRTGLSLVNPASGAHEVALAPGAIAFTDASWSKDGRRLALVGSTAGAPPDVYAGAPGQAPTRLVNSNPQLDALPHGAQETIRYAASDGLEIEGVLIRPVGFTEGARRPLIVVVHGGPESQYLDGWNSSYSAPGHALAERGYFVFFPNYRGSTGRGVGYAKGDHHDLGGKEFEDVLDGVAHLASKGWIDPARVGITGGSYGGYFTALGVTRYSEHFAAGVELFGITNWESFLGQTDIPAENSMVHWDLWCYEHVDLCRDASPVAHVQKARTPTLILQGEKDERVPKPQSDELYAALRWKKVPVEYVAYPREKHGFRERWHRIDALTRLLGWMERYLRGRGAGAAPG